MARYLLLDVDSVIVMLPDYHRVWATGRRGGPDLIQRFRVEQIDRLTKLGDAFVVLTSSWRLVSRHIADFREAFKIHGIAPPEPLFGTGPGPRCDSIRDFVGTLKPDERYVILDDDPSAASGVLGPNGLFIQTHEPVGLTEDDVTLALAFFKQEPEHAFGHCPPG